MILKVIIDRNNNLFNVWDKMFGHSFQRFLRMFLRIFIRFFNYNLTFIDKPIYRQQKIFHSDNPQKLTNAIQMRVNLNFLLSMICSIGTLTTSCQFNVSNGIHLNDININRMRWAENTVQMSKPTANLQLFLYEFENAGKQQTIDINEKTKYMHIYFQIASQNQLKLVVDNRRHHCIWRCKTFNLARC